MITGNKDIINQLFDKLDDRYERTYGYIMKKDYGDKLKFSGKTKIADDVDLYEISKLICSDENIGSTYKIDSLYHQLLERKNEKHCKNIYMKDKNRYIAHAGTYADIDKFSIIGGVITDPDYRGAGIGRILVNDMLYLIFGEKKSAILYCYSNKLKKWYSSLGFHLVKECAKLQKRKSFEDYE